MNNFSSELLRILQQAFAYKFNSSKNIKELNRLLFENKATYKQANKFSEILGEMLAEVYTENLSSEILPDGKMDIELAREIIDPTMKRNYELISEYSRVVQDRLNKLSGISIKGIKAKINQDRIDGIVKRISMKEEFDKIKWILNEPVINYSQSIIDDTIKANAEFQTESGLKPIIIREEVGDCCDWCKEVVGIYQYPDEVPEDVYRRHRYCRCTVEYLPGDGRRQNVHTKKWKKENTTLKDFRNNEINDIINNKKIKDIKEIGKAQKRLKKSILGKKINGVEIKNVSIHVAERAIERHVTVENIVDAAINPLKIGKIKYDKENRPSFEVVGKKATIYINPTNQTITTTYKTSSKKAKKLLEDKT